MNKIRSGLTSTLLLVTPPVFGEFSDNYEFTKYEQYVFDEKAGQQYTLRNKTDKYAFCAVSINDGVGVKLLFVGPKKTVNFDVAYQKYSNNNRYKFAMKIACRRFSPDEKMTAIVMNGLVDMMKRTASSLGGYLPEPKTSEKPVFKNLNIYYNRKYRVSKDRQEIADDYLLSATDNDFYYVCTIGSKNLNHDMKVLIPSKTTLRFHMIPTENGKIVFKQKCNGYNFKYDYSMQYIYMDSQ